MRNNVVETNSAWGTEMKYFFSPVAHRFAATDSQEFFTPTELTSVPSNPIQEDGLKSLVIPTLDDIFLLCGLVLIPSHQIDVL